MKLFKSESRERWQLLKFSSQDWKKWLSLTSALEHDQNTPHPKKEEEKNKRAFLYSVCIFQIKGAPFYDNTRTVTLVSRKDMLC